MLKFKSICVGNEFPKFRFDQIPRLVYGIKQFRYVGSRYCLFDKFLREAKLNVSDVFKVITSCIVISVLGTARQY